MVKRAGHERACVFMQHPAKPCRHFPCRPPCKGEHQYPLRVNTALYKMRCPCYDCICLSGSSARKHQHVSGGMFCGCFLLRV